MNCRTAQTLISAYADNELTGMETLSLREHLRACPECRLEIESTIAVKQRFQSLATIEPPSGLESRLMNAVVTSRANRTGTLALTGLLATASLAAAILAIRMADQPTVPSQPIAKTSTDRLELAADRAYLGGSDPMSGVQVVTVGYAGDH